MKPIRKVSAGDSKCKEITISNGTKNIPDAIDWHFSGTWNHMFVNVPSYRDTWKTQWSKTAELLARSIAIPILVKTTKEELDKHLDVINSIMAKI